MNDDLSPSGGLLVTSCWLLVSGYAAGLPEDNQALQMRPWQSHREQGRQSTDGGERSVTPGHGFHNKSPLLGEGQGWGHSSFIIYKSSLAMRVLDVVEVLVVFEFPAPLHCQRYLTRLGTSLPSQGR